MAIKENDLVARLTFPRDLPEHEREKVRAFYPHPGTTGIGYCFRRKLAPAEQGDEVWDAEMVTDPEPGR